MTIKSVMTFYIWIMICVTVYISEKCSVCSRVVGSVKRIVKNYSFIKYQVINVTEINNKCSIVPALYINNELYCYGEFEDKKLLANVFKLLPPKYYSQS